MRCPGSAGEWSKSAAILATVSVDIPASAFGLRGGSSIEELDARHAGLTPSEAEFAGRVGIPGSVLVLIFLLCLVSSFFIFQHFLFEYSEVFRPPPAEFLFRDVCNFDEHACLNALRAFGGCLNAPRRLQGWK